MEYIVGLTLSRLFCGAAAAPLRGWACTASA